MTDQDTTCTMCTRVISEDEWPICQYCDHEIDLALEQLETEFDEWEDE